MQRLIIWLGALLLFSSLIEVPSVGQSASAQDADAQATIEALQTRIADLEEQLVITPTPTPDESASAKNDERTQLTLGGTANAVLPRGETDSLELIAVGAYRGYIPLVVRNNSKNTLDRITVSVTVRSADGSLLASGDNEEVTHPHRLGPGEVAFSDIPLNNIALPSNAVFDFSLESRTAGAVDESYLIDLEITEVSQLADRIVGEARNASGRTVYGSQASGMCFNANGLPTIQLLEGINPATIPPDETSTFQSDSSAIARECSAFLVAARGARE